MEGLLLAVGVKLGEPLYSGTGVREEGLLIDVDTPQKTPLVLAMGVRGEALLLVLGMTPLKTPDSGSGCEKGRAPPFCEHVTLNTPLFSHWR